MADQYKLNLFTGRLDNVGTGSLYAGDVGSMPTGQNDGYLAVVGDTLYYFSDGNRYRITATLTPAAGSPIGLLLSLTYAT
jgi:hypothetical protein